jgi:hypothetical protein
MGENFAAATRSPSGVASKATVSDIGLLMQTCALNWCDTLMTRWRCSRWCWVGDPKSFAEWLHRAARVVPPRVRWVVVDRIEAPLLDTLDGSHVRSVIANLDMAGALEPTLRWSTRARPGSIISERPFQSKQRDGAICHEVPAQIGLASVIDPNLNR